MPQVFRIGPYLIYFWSNENEPVEPVHVHVSEKVPSPNATKFWITSTGKCLLSNNNSKIPPKALKIVRATIEAQADLVLEKWHEYFGEVTYYC